MKLVAAALAGILMLAGCGDKGSGYVLPRGATLSVRTVNDISTGDQKAGDPFVAEIDVPVREGLTTYIPLQSEAEGVVEESAVQAGNPAVARLALRLTKLHLPGGVVLELETSPLTHESRTEVELNEVTITTGLDVDLDRLLGRSQTRAGATERAGPRVTIARNSPLVFTLSEDLRILTSSAE